MRRTNALAALLVAGVSLSLIAGCEKKTEPTPGAASAEAASSAQPATSAAAAPTASALSAAPMGKMANCPNLVEGSATR